MVEVGVPLIRQQVLRDQYVAAHGFVAYGVVEEGYEVKLYCLLLELVCLSQSKPPLEAQLQHCEVGG